jgi:hypothetical protein
MSSRFSQCAVIAAALLLAGCSYADDLFGTNMAGEHESADTSAPVATTQTPTVPTPAPTTRAAPAQASGGSSTGTIVGQKVQSLRNDLSRLKSDLAQRQQDTAHARQAVQVDSSSYFNTVAAINAKLQAGTTAGNPQLIAQWNQAQTMLDKLSEDTGRLSAISTKAAADSSFAAYLMNATRAAFSLQGAVDEDHQQLTQIQTEIDATTVQIDALLNSLSDEISRQGNYVANERENLITLSQAIKNGQLFGPSLANRSFGSPSVAVSRIPAPAQRASTSHAAPPAASADNRPLVVIRFDRPNVVYEQALYTAVSRALERKPSATFELVAVAPAAGSAAQVAVNSNASKRNAENVMRSLTNMGLPPDRISLSATTSADVQNNEVRLYVR